MEKRENAAIQKSPEALGEMRLIFHYYVLLCFVLLGTDTFFQTFSIDSKILIKEIDGESILDTAIAKITRKKYGRGLDFKGQGMEPDVDYNNRTRVEFTHARAQESRLCYILRREAIGPGKEVTSYRIQCHPCNNDQKKKCSRRKRNQIRQNQDPEEALSEKVEVKAPTSPCSHELKGNMGTDHNMSQ